MLPTAKNRSRRLRKKLRVNEFQELGFEFSASLKEGVTPEQENVLIDRFLNEVIEPKGLALGGWISGGFIATFERGSVSIEDRAAIESWLKQLPELDSCQVGELIDAWYGPFD